ncbi:hypothetical protein ACLOJK_022426 [Asimina triloba]
MGGGVATVCRRTPPTAPVRLLVDLGERLVGLTCCRIAMEGRSDGVAPLPVLGLLSVVESRRGRSRILLDLRPIAASARLCPPLEMRREDDAHAARPSRATAARRDGFSGQPCLPLVWVMEHHILVLRWSMGRGVPAAF